MIHEHPLAYLLGIEGLALLRCFTGEFDRAFAEARLAEVRALLADQSLAGVDVERVDTVSGYRIWSATYDDGPNGAFAIDEPVIKNIVGALPPGLAVDAACGTGRYSAWLAGFGHQVIGVDSSPDMLRLARTRVPSGDFRLGDLHDLPVETADLIVCGLALTHVPSLDPVFAEFARVLRPGGHLVVCDIHPERVLRGSVPAVRGPDGQPGRVVTYRHQIGDYLRAALEAGLALRRCEEPGVELDGGPAATEPGPWDAWPWSLAAMVPEAAVAVFNDAPAMLVLQFQR